jgi:hypothetical protein
VTDEPAPGSPTPDTGRGDDRVRPEASPASRLTWGSDLFGNGAFYTALARCWGLRAGPAGFEKTRASAATGRHLRRSRRCACSEPDLRGDPEVLPETKRRVRREGALAVHDLADPVRRNADVPGESGDGDAERTHELLSEDLTGRDRVQPLPAHHVSSVVVHDLDVVDAVFPPPKADPPLVVDADAVLTLAASAEGFEAVARRHSQVP